EAAIRRLMARRVDGLFLSPVYRLAQRAAVYEDLRARKNPTVLLGHAAPFCGGFATVETDDVTASYNVTRHLLELGHRRIAFLAGPQVAPWAAERFEGYRRALREAGREVDDRLIFAAGSNIEDGVRAATQLMSEGVKATALQAVNDMVAIGAADTLLNQGVRIPTDVSVAGFGNTLVAEYFRVPLTTVRQPKLRLGAMAMDTMLKLIKGEPVEPQRLPAEMIVRHSTAAPLPAA
ncbi:MAG: substrate-binding domain-containing protein, partial [Verrucomicrobia bacterium]|nr:substrate-binding domain-containing protein [Verrucomicrobiota bacterium]